ncbi:MAG: tRNA (N(6)-L-threonylcarbamoyladenosine(37)-C(2))-methylthiotransferase MtaB [Planctomycetota bacterium]
MSKSCSFVTFGCKINQYDTQAIRETVLDLGYVEVADGAAADLYIVNSCTVTEHAGDKGVAAVRRLRARSPTSKILVTGCLSPEDRAQLKTVPGVEHVVGNEDKDQIPALLMGAEFVPSKVRRSRRIFNLRASRFEGRTRAFLKVHDGCDDFCSYCIIPMVRGKSQSRPIQDVLAEARRFAAAGYQELVITGIHLRRYGQDLGLERGLVELLAALRAIPGIERVRLSSIGIRAFTAEFLALFASDPGLCPFFHIPLQSGANTVLERMRREYTAEFFLGQLDRIRAALPRAVIATDLMVGFPGETESEFAESIAVCRSARFAFLHLFPYSRRSGTKAVQLSDHVTPEVKMARMACGRTVEAELFARDAERWMGTNVRVLVEHHVGRAEGLSREGHRVELTVPSAGVAPNRELEVRIHGRRDRLLLGTCVGADEAKL